MIRYNGDPGPRVILCGDNCVNVILETPQALRRGGNLDVLRSVRRPGGNALVTALVLAGWGVRAGYVGVVGDDTGGQELLAWMQQAGTGAEGMVRRGRTRVSYAIVDPSDRTIVDERAGVGQLSGEDWLSNHEMKNVVSDADLVMVDRYCSGIHNLVAAEARKRRASGKRTALAYRTGSRASPGLQVEAQVLPASDLCLTKRAYMGSLFPDIGPVEACRRLSDEFGVPAVIATIGSDGAAYYDRGEGDGGVVPVRRLEHPATTLGGGDFFRAGFVYATLHGSSLPEAIRWGNAAAALHCRKPEADGLSSLLLPVEAVAEAAARQQ